MYLIYWAVPDVPEINIIPAYSGGDQSLSTLTIIINETVSTSCVKIYCCMVHTFTHI